MSTRSGRTAARKSSTVVSPSLKPLLPASSMTPNMDPTLPSPMSMSTPNTPHALPMVTTASGSAVPGSSTTSAQQPTMHIRKTSHKAAEQKRRDSLKTTFDDLRKLLPPIALPNDADVDPGMITSPLFHPTTPLLPGALPPRGPPKAGGEGPNKGVSKLQLLICGNEYIRLLKGRVERRDDEIAQLRREIGRLRVVVEERGGDDDVLQEGGELDGGGGGGREVLDLEKDLDAIEKMGGMGSSAGSGMKSSDVNGGGDDAMDEGDDEGDE
ncbi:hypothetical protein BDZ97DRAFT_623026 [Flammula alnicola]|nr:hypothetical protein BDZ97DRAFT_623026 [Flammula alnicola]